MNKLLVVLKWTLVRSWVGVELRMTNGLMRLIVAIAGIGWPLLGPSMAGRWLQLVVSRCIFERFWNGSDTCLDFGGRLVGPDWPRPAMESQSIASQLLSLPSQVLANSERWSTKCWPIAISTLSDPTRSYGFTCGTRLRCLWGPPCGHLGRSMGRLWVDFW